jgi:hypothetical protein
LSQAIAVSYRKERRSELACGPTKRNLAMTTARPLSEHEKILVAALLRANPKLAGLADSLDQLLAREMQDGGMGSLVLIPPGLKHSRRSFGQEVAKGEFLDADGVPVSVAINTDNEGRLFELDVWKVNFAPLVALPDPSAIRIV